MSDTLASEYGNETDLIRAFQVVMPDDNSFCCRIVGFHYLIKGGVANEGSLLAYL